MGRRITSCSVARQARVNIISNGENTVLRSIKSQNRFGRRWVSNFGCTRARGNLILNIYTCSLQGNFGACMRLGHKSNPGTTSLLSSKRE
ncbi:hypothetical protein V6N13_118145 [Hibiscus sabdariffa]